MDMSFAVQAKTLSYLATCADKLPLDVLPVPEAIDQEVAHMKVCSMGMGMDALSEAQAAYIGKEG
jgi:adenosylhomocysteinase